MLLGRLLSVFAVGLACAVATASRPVTHSAVAGTLVQYAAPMQIEKIFDNGNIYAVNNQPTRASEFTLNQPTRITKITTYHWNNGRGAPAGMIGLLSRSGEIQGPWQATGQPGQGGVPSAYWVVEPSVSLAAGTYTVIDSNPATWAQNAATSGAGMFSVEGNRE